MTAFWTWFKSDGDKLCNFVSLTSLNLMGMKALAGVGPALPGPVLLGCLVAGVIATSAHQAFFPSAQALVAQERARFLVSNSPNPGIKP